MQCKSLWLLPTCFVKVTTVVQIHIEPFKRPFISVYRMYSDETCLEHFSPMVKCTSYKQSYATDIAFVQTSF